MPSHRLCTRNVILFIGFGFVAVAGGPVAALTLGVASVARTVATGNRTVAREAGTVVTGDRTVAAEADVGITNLRGRLGMDDAVKDCLSLTSGNRVLEKDLDGGLFLEMLQVLSCPQALSITLGVMEDPRFNDFTAKLGEMNLGVAGGENSCAVLLVTATEPSSTGDQNAQYDRQYSMAFGYKTNGKCEFPSGFLEMGPQLKLLLRSNIGNVNSSIDQFKEWWNQYGGMVLTLLGISGVAGAIYCRKEIGEAASRGCAEVCATLRGTCSSRGGSLGSGLLNGRA